MDCKVIFDYKAVEEDELDLKKGEFLSDVISGGDLEDGWWSGVLNGKRGVFPNNFVEPISPLPSIPNPVPVPPPAHANTSPPSNNAGMECLCTQLSSDNRISFFTFFDVCRC